MQWKRLVFRLYSHRWRNFTALAWCPQCLNHKGCKPILKAPALERGRVLRKPCTEKGRQAPGSENRRLHQISQQTKQTAKLLRTLPSTYNSAFPNEDFESAAQLHLAEVHAKGNLEEKGIVAAMETVQTQRSGTVDQYSQQQELTTISLEEKKILLCLDRLNHQLQCVQERVGGNTSMHGLVLSDAPYTREVKASNHNKHCGSSTNNHSRYHQKSWLEACVRHSSLEPSSVHFMLKHVVETSTYYPAKGIFTKCVFLSN